jgi:hypothetical protein
MKRIFEIVLVTTTIVMGVSCTKSQDNPKPNNGVYNKIYPYSTQEVYSNPRQFQVTDEAFTTWFIPAGQNYATGTTYPPFTRRELKFIAVLDSSCIYTTVNPANQADINKLYGFSDNGTHHQTNSARFGWNWENGVMHLHAYCYVSGVRTHKELGTVSLNLPVECGIEVQPGRYIFTLNGQKDTIARTSTDTVADGYMLQPYFGGDEPAPHDITIKIKEIE